MPSDFAVKSGMTAEIRRGIHRPDWSIVTRPAARNALVGRNRTRCGLVDKWNQTLEPEQDRVWRTVLELFAVLGRPPLLSEIGKETTISVENLRVLVSKLQAHDLLGIDEAAGTIAYAYPFTGQETEHHVQLHGRKLYAVCAIDALGIAGMLRTDAVIESSCRACGSRIEIATAQAGKSLSRARPGDAVVWYDLAYSGRSGILLSGNRVLLLRCRPAAMVDRTSLATCRLSAHTRRCTASEPGPLRARSHHRKRALIPGL